MLNHFRPIIASEIEFYLYHIVKVDEETVISKISEALKEQNIDLIEVIKETGKGQYEIKLNYTGNPDKLAYDIENARKITMREAIKYNAAALFGAKPFINQPSSGMHIHIHLEDNKGNKLFYREGESYSEIMLYSIGGLLATMKENLPFFAPNRQSITRFEMGGKETPTTVSWGNNNRTVALRIPTENSPSSQPSPLKGEEVKSTRRIEHRVAGADANPAEVIKAVLGGINYGIENKITPPTPQIFGDANLDMYDLEKIV